MFPPCAAEFLTAYERAVAAGSVKSTPVRKVNRGSTTIGDPSALPLLFWLHRETLTERIEAEIDALADDANALTAEQRTEQVGEIDRDRLAIQREEEHWVSKAIEDGANMLRRPDADPRAVLGLADDMPAR